MGNSANKEEKRESKRAFKSIDTDGSHTVSREELATFVGSHAELWAMLVVNLGIGEDKCKEIATRVAFELACGHQSDDSLRVSSITPQQFRTFHAKYINDPKGSQEFFHRAVFAAFDEDGNSTLDAGELDKFLDTFYEAESIFKGDARLPEKDDLKKLVNEKLDVDGDGKFSFEEIRSLISGSAARGDLLN